MAMEMKVRPVDVISLCSADGEIRPLRMRMQGENQQSIRIDIQQILCIQNVNHLGAEAHIYLCRGVIDMLECTIQLKYTIRTHTWTLLDQTI